MDEKLIFYVISLLLIIFFFVGYNNGNLRYNFNQKHMEGLGFIVGSSIMMWLGLIWMRNPDKVEFLEQDKMSFAFSIIIGLLTWGRLVYSVYD